jgi:hypothetical protein
MGILESLAGMFSRANATLDEETNKYVRTGNKPLTDAQIEHNYEADNGKGSWAKIGAESQTLTPEEQRQHEATTEALREKWAREDALAAVLKDRKDLEQIPLTRAEEDMLLKQANSPAPIRAAGGPNVAQMDR